MRRVRWKAVYGPLKHALDILEKFDERFLRLARIALPNEKEHLSSG
jgi:hypothetical protein